MAVATTARRIRCSATAAAAAAAATAATTAEHSVRMRVEEFEKAVEAPHRSSRLVALFGFEDVHLSIIG
jgi:hypothetical protein